MSDFSIAAIRRLSSGKRHVVFWKTAHCILENSTLYSRKRHNCLLESDTLSSEKRHLFFGKATHCHIVALFILQNIAFVVNKHSSITTHIDR